MEKHIKIKFLPGGAHVFMRRIYNKKGSAFPQPLPLGVVWLSVMTAMVVMAVVGVMPAMVVVGAIPVIGPCAHIYVGTMNMTMETCTCFGSMPAILGARGLGGCQADE